MLSAEEVGIGAFWLAVKSCTYDMRDRSWDFNLQSPLSTELRISPLTVVSSNSYAKFLVISIKFISPAIC